jgi:putative acyl-CoA dehydrogenase
VHTKRGATLGMGMTEKQGGSDVRANTTRAEPLATREPGQPYRLTGHKWFFSAPMCDGFLVLANAPGGLSCFLLPRFHDGALQSGVRLQRLKDKLGNRSNASAEVEFAGAIAWLVGDEGRGVQTILEMVNVTRLDCGLGSAGVMRQALAQALHHARHRRAFGRPLVQQPLMRNVLADLALESEAATALMLRLARTFDAPDDPTETALRRIATPAAKFWICKRLAAFTQEAMEVLGGSGYVEEHNLARLYREAPLNSIWEGSGNIMCLDVLRVTRNSAALAAVFDEIDRARGGDPRLDAAVADLRADFASYAATADEGAARLLCSRLMLALQAALLVMHAPHAVADGFCASRIATPPAAVFGALPAGCDMGAIIARAWPGQIDQGLEAPLGSAQGPT